MSFEHHNQLVLARKFSRHFQAVRLNFRDAQPCQARHLSRMRRDDKRSPTSVQLSSHAFESIQRIRIDHHAGRVAGRSACTLDDGADKFRSLRIPRDAGTNGKRLPRQQ